MYLFLYKLRASLNAGFFVAFGQQEPLFELFFALWDP